LILLSSVSRSSQHSRRGMTRGSSHGSRGSQYNKGQVKKQFVVPVAGPLEQLGS
jgi:hypothetical protein